jgi:hypothetical protein
MKSDMGNTRDAQTDKTQNLDQHIIGPEMVQAWGYPLDDFSQILITRGRELEDQGHINSIAGAKRWIRGEREKPGGTFASYPKLEFPEGQN